MRPTKEDACRMLSVLREHGKGVNEEAYGALYSFILNCTKYLPSRQAVARDHHKKRPGRYKVIPPPEE